MEYAITSIFILHENIHATRVETFSTNRDVKVFSARLPSIKPRFESRCHMWIECSVVLDLAQSVFLQVFSSFPPSTTNQHSKLQFDFEARTLQQAYESSSVFRG